MANISDVVVLFLVCFVASSLSAFSTVPLTCFPTPAPTPPPLPCITPVGLDPALSTPNIDGELSFQVDPTDGLHGSTFAMLTLSGLNPERHIVTAWVSYFFPGGPLPTCPGCDIFVNTGAVSAPLAHTKAAYTFGMDPSGEPNYFNINGAGIGRLTVNLDYDFLVANNGPLRNVISTTDQVGGTPPANQPDFCCPTQFAGPNPNVPGSRQSVGTQFLRRFNQTTGYQEFEADGKTPKLHRSPLPVAFLAIVAHLDKDNNGNQLGMTHGINPGNPVLPIPGNTVNNGDHWLLGIFDLRPFH